jgi:hypothetical protein
VLNACGIFAIGSAFSAPIANFPQTFSSPFYLGRYIPVFGVSFYPEELLSQPSSGVIDATHVSGLLIQLGRSTDFY